MSCPPLPLAELSAAFRQRGELMARFAPGAAEAFAFCAEWLEASLAAHLGEVVNLQAAARETGWSYEGLRRRLHEDPSLNAGEPGAPLIRRSDLPRLGAPRGPRGPYGPRKPRPRQGTAVDAEAPAVGEADDLADAREAESAAPGDAVRASEAGATKTNGAPGTPEPQPADKFRPPPGRAPGKRAASGERKRPVRPPTRRRTSKERFTELLALAARP